MAECIAGEEHNIISVSSNFEEPDKFFGKCSKCGEFVPIEDEDRAKLNVLNN